MAYFANGLHPVLFTPKPLPRRGAPGVQTLFFSPPDDQASEVYPHNRLGRFITTTDAPRSTLAPRNDTSAYPLLRRFLAHGALPPIGVLRIESLIDHFPPATPVVHAFGHSGPPLQLRAELGPCPWNPSNRLAHVRLEASQPRLRDRLVIVILDVSHSMSTPDRLPLLKQGLTSLLDGLALASDNRVAVVAAAHHEALVLPPTALGDRPTIDAAISELRTRDNHYTLVGRSLADDLFRQRRPHEQVHIILASDHDHAQDLPPPHPDLRVSILGVGERDYDDKALGELATANDGELRYLDSIAEARETFTDLALWQAGPLVARDIQVQASFDPATVARYHLVGHANSSISAAEFTRDFPTADPVPGGPHLGRRRAGDLAAGQAMNFLYELEPTTKTPLAFTFSVRARINNRDQRLTQVITDTGADLKTTSDNFRFVAALAELGLLVQGGPRGEASLTQVRELATTALAGITLPTPKPREFLTLLDLLEPHLEARLAHWADADAWSRAHPIAAHSPAVRAAAQIPTSSLPSLEFEAMRMRGWGRHALVGVHDGREGASPDERAAIATARAEAVERHLVEVMGHPQEQYELRPMTPGDVLPATTAAERAHNRRVQLESIRP